MVHRAADRTTLHRAPVHREDEPAGTRESCCLWGRSIPTVPRLVGSGDLHRRWCGRRTRPRVPGSAPPPRHRSTGAKMCSRPHRRRTRLRMRPVDQRLAWAPELPVEGALPESATLTPTKPFRPSSGTCSGRHWGPGTSREEDCSSHVHFRCFDQAMRPGRSSRSGRS